MILAVYVPVSDDFGSGYGVVFAQDSERSGEEKKTRKVSGISEKTYRKFAEAQEFMEADNYQAALKVLDEVKAKKNLTSTEAIQLYSFYGVLYFSQERYKESITAFERMLKEEDLEDRQRTETLYTLAQLHFTIEDYRRAADIMNRWLAVVENPGPEPFILLASAYYQLEQYNDMIEPIDAVESTVAKQCAPQSFARVSRARVVQVHQHVARGQVTSRRPHDASQSGHRLQLDQGEAEGQLVVAGFVHVPADAEEPCAALILCAYCGKAFGAMAQNEWNGGQSLHIVDDSGAAP